MAHNNLNNNKKYTRLTNNQKAEIITYHEANLSRSDQFLSDLFTIKFKVPVSRRTINRILNYTEDIIKRSHFNPVSKSNKQPKNFELEEKMVLYIEKMEILGATLTDDLLLQKGKKFGEELGLKGFKASGGWLQKFKKRNLIKLRNLYGGNP